MQCEWLGRDRNSGPSPVIRFVDLGDSPRESPIFKGVSFLTAGHAPAAPSTSVPPTPPAAAADAEAEDKKKGGPPGSPLFLAGRPMSYIMPSMPGWPWPPQPQDSFFSGMSVTMQSVVSSNPAIDAAF